MRDSIYYWMDHVWLTGGADGDTEGTPDSTPKPLPGLVPDYTAWLRSSISSYEALAKALLGHRAERAASLGRQLDRRGDGEFGWDGLGWGQGGSLDRSSKQSH
jgi:hypothetical protein